jgi:hypothetical protein
VGLIRAVEFSRYKRGAIPLKQGDADSAFQLPPASGIASMSFRLPCGIRIALALLAVHLTFSLAASTAFADGKRSGGSHQSGNMPRSFSGGNFKPQTFKPISGAGLNLNSNANLQRLNGVKQVQPLQHLSKPIQQSQHQSPAGGGFPKVTGIPQKLSGVGNLNHQNGQHHNGPQQGIKSKIDLSKAMPHNAIKDHVHQGNKQHPGLDPWFGGKGPTKIASHQHPGKITHSGPYFKDCHGQPHKHYCHYHQCFSGWWYRGSSYCSVIAIPSQPVVVGAAAQPAPQPMILIANLPTNEAEVGYLVDGRMVRTAAGEVEPISAASAEVVFDRGGGFGVARMSLDPGTYEFHRTPEGWQLYRKTFRVTVENRGALDLFRFQADGKPVELPAGNQMQFETSFPLTLTFDQNGQPVSRQLADGTFVIAPSEAGLLDLAVVEAR